MGCCGNKRAALAQQNKTKAVGPAGGVTGQVQIRTTTEAVYFQYVGNAALSVRGMFSQRVYRFSAPGSVLAVDGRDAPGMAAVPKLKRLQAAAE